MNQFSKFSNKTKFKPPHIFCSVVFPWPKLGTTHSLGYNDNSSAFLNNEKTFYFPTKLRNWKEVKWRTKHTCYLKHISDYLYTTQQKTCMIIIYHTSYITISWVVLKIRVTSSKNYFISSLFWRNEYCFVIIIWHKAAQTDKENACIKPTQQYWRHNSNSSAFSVCMQKFQ